MADEYDTEPKDLLTLVWVHGFKGTDVTFEDLPPRIVRILEETHPSLRVQSHVFPAYETRGELNAATENFVEWLATKVVQLENNEGRGRGAGSAKVILMGHSMGGLLIADATARIAAGTREGDPLWPNVVATIAFDTPYLGLHPHVFKNQMSTAAGHVETARNVASNLAMLSPLAVGFGFGKAKQAQDARAETEAKTDADKPRSATPPGGQQASSWWSTPSTKAVLGIGALVGAAAAGAAYYHRQEFANGWKYGYDHMTFVKNLWDADGLRTRLETVRELSMSHNVRFANYYTMIPPGGGFLKRTFAILPSSGEGTRQWWIPARNSIAKDEVAAHMGMFNPRENDGFYDLGLVVVGLIADRIEEEGVQRGVKPLDLELVNVVD